MTDGHLTDGGKDSAVNCCHNYIDWLKTDNISYEDTHKQTTLEDGTSDGAEHECAKARYLFKLLHNAR